MFGCPNVSPRLGNSSGTAPSHEQRHDDGTEDDDGPGNKPAHVDHFENRQTPARIALTMLDRAHGLRM